MEIEFKIDQEKVAKEIIAGINKTILNDKFCKVIENKAYEFTRDFEKHLGDTVRWAMQKKIESLMDSEDYGPKIDKAIKDAFDKKLPALGEEFLNKVTIRNY